MGFRCFSLRGLRKVRTGSTPVTPAYNLTGLFQLGCALSDA
jgi:hypothetical protein